MKSASYQHFHDQFNNLHKENQAESKWVEETLTNFHKLNSNWTKLNMFSNPTTLVIFKLSKTSPQKAGNHPSNRWTQETKSLVINLQTELTKQTCNKYFSNFKNYWQNFEANFESFEPPSNFHNPYSRISHKRIPSDPKFTAP